MTDANDIRDSGNQDTQATLTESEIVQLIQESARLYEEGIQISDLAGLVDLPEESQPRYAWDTPIGLVVTGGSHASLV